MKNINEEIQNKFNQKEIEEFVYCYNTIKKFRENIQKLYEEDQSKLTDLELYTLKNIIKYQPYKIDVITDDFTEDYIEYDFETEEGINNAAIEMYIAQLIRFNYDFPDNLVQQKDRENVINYLRLFLLKNPKKLTEKSLINLKIIKSYLKRNDLHGLKMFGFNNRTNISINEIMKQKPEEVDLRNIR